MKTREALRLCKWKPSAFTSQRMGNPLATFAVYISSSAQIYDIKSHLYSILHQNCDDFDVIIVNDNLDIWISGQLDLIPLEDPRVSLIHFSCTLGLMGLGWLAATYHARTEYVIYSDCTGSYTEDFWREIRGALNSQQTDIVWCNSKPNDKRLQLGNSRVYSPNNNKDILLGSELELCSVAIRSKIFELVGFFDINPAVNCFIIRDFFQRAIHVSMCTFIDKVLYLCDHSTSSFAERLSFVDDSWFCSDYMSFCLEARSSTLSINNIEDYDLFSISGPLLDLYKPRLSLALQQWFLSLPALSQRFVCASSDTFRRLDRSLSISSLGLRSNSTCNHENDILSITRRSRVMLIVVSIAASEQLVFSAVMPYINLIVRHADKATLTEGFEADIIIFSRNIIHLQGVQSLVYTLSVMGKKIYWYADDNFVALSKDPSLCEAFSNYTQPKVFESLCYFNGILSTSDELVQAYSGFFPDKPCFLLNPVYQRLVEDDSLPSFVNYNSKDKTGCHVVAFIGQSHRFQSLTNYVLPAISLLIACGIPIRLVHFGGDQITKLASEHGIATTELVPTYDYSHLCRQLIQHNVEVLLHPKSESLNARYKTANSLITATSCGAVLIAENERQYDKVPACAMIFVDDQIESWRKGLVSGLDPSSRINIFNCAHEYCKSFYGASRNIDIINHLASQDLCRP